MRFALFTIDAMALWHRAGISSSSGGSGSYMTSLACVCVCLYGAFGVGCDWCVDVLFGEHAFRCVPESRDAFELSCV